MTPAELQALINAQITTNGAGAITGAILNGILTDMLAILEANSVVIAYLQALPTTMPATVGTIWNNGGIVSIVQP